MSKAKNVNEVDVGDVVPIAQAVPQTSEDATLDLPPVGPQAIGTKIATKHFVGFGIFKGKVVGTDLDNEGEVLYNVEYTDVGAQ